MNLIEQQVYQLIEQLSLGNVELSDELINEFGERAKLVVKDKLKEAKEKKFTLRMSNIGRPLRQLMLDKKFGYAPSSPDFVLKMLYGSLYEALTLMLLKASEVNITEHDKAVKLAIADTIIEGTLDVIIDGKVYDIKTASQYAYEQKFTSWEVLANSDDFGYMAQGFGYAVANKCKFGGWIVINKSTGQLKIIEIPDDVHDSLADKYLKEIEHTITYMAGDNPIPVCIGAVKETYYKKPTGNIVLDNSCRFCSHKEHCHPGIQYLPSKASKSETPKYVWYVKVKDKENEI